MVKHIVGLILFSMIVGISVFASAVTNYSGSSSVKVADNYRLLKKKKKRKRKRRCRPRHPHSKATLSQITFDRDSKLLSATFEAGHRSRRHGDVQLHFFAKDRNGARFLKTEYLAYTGAGIESSREMPWLSRLDSQQNIYVIAESFGSRRGWTYPPEFDSATATPLLVSRK